VEGEQSATPAVVNNKITLPLTNIPQTLKGTQKKDESDTSEFQEDDEESDEDFSEDKSEEIKVKKAVK
jgi:hypothetical protein